MPPEDITDAGRTFARAALGGPIRDLATTRLGAVNYAVCADAAQAAGPGIRAMRQLARQGPLRRGGDRGRVRANGSAARRSAARSPSRVARRPTGRAAAARISARAVRTVCGRRAAGQRDELDVAHRCQLTE